MKKSRNSAVNFSSLGHFQCQWGPRVNNKVGTNNNACVKWVFRTETLGEKSQYSQIAA